MDNLEIWCFYVIIFQKCGPQAQSTPLTERFGGSITNKSQSSTRDSFDDLNDCVLPVIPPSHSPTRRSKEDSTREDDPMADSDDSSLAAAFDVSLRISPGHNDSCGSMATLAEGAPLQCTTVMLVSLQYMFALSKTFRLRRCPNLNICKNQDVQAHLSW
ncbi:hypothetical protein COOONC_17166 [Cooperia oncophora]